MSAIKEQPSNMYSRNTFSRDRPSRFENRIKNNKQVIINNQNSVGLLPHISSAVSLENHSLGHRGIVVTKEHNPQ